MNKKIKILLYIIIPLLVIYSLFYAYEHDFLGFKSKNTKTYSNSTTSLKPTQNIQPKNTPPSSSDWISSSNGSITLEEPVANSTVHSGDTISGTATVSKVEYILTDTKLGLIAKSDLNVVNGTFSGTLKFIPHSSNGSLQIYYPNPTNGAEEDLINVNVNF